MGTPLYNARNSTSPGTRAQSGGPGRLAHAFGIFFFALHVPYVSMLGIAVALAPGALWLPRLFVRRPRFLLCSLLLGASLVSYYFVAADFGYVKLESGMGYAAVAVVAYLAGYARGATDTSLRVGSASGLIAAVAGAGAFTAASVWWADPTQLAMRAAPSIWSGESFNAPGLGALASLGMSLLAVTVFAASADLRTRLLIWLVFPAVGVVGVVSNVVLRNRTPFLALVATFLVVGWLSSRDRQVLLTKRIGQLGAALLVLAIGALAGVSWFESTEIGMRFRSEGLSTARYEVWGMVLSGLLDHPWGGRAIVITEPYAHNLWLDMAWNAGVVPAALMLAFHLLHAGPALEFFRKAEGPLKLTVAAVGVALLFTAMGEPVPAFPIAFLSLLNYHAGLTLGLRDRVRSG